MRTQARAHSTEPKGLGMVPRPDSAWLSRFLRHRGHQGGSEGCARGAPYPRFGSTMRFVSRRGVRLGCGSGALVVECQITLRQERDQLRAPKENERPSRRLA